METIVQSKSNAIMLMSRLRNKSKICGISTWCCSSSKKCGDALLLLCDEEKDEDEDDALLIIKCFMLEIFSLSGISLGDKKKDDEDGGDENEDLFGVFVAASSALC